MRGIGEGTTSCRVIDKMQGAWCTAGAMIPMRAMTNSASQDGTAILREYYSWFGLGFAANTASRGVQSFDLELIRSDLGKCDA